ncbi:uncharacterized protein CLUP02_16834 [Colletotrichum lupini]|uniref:Uncharacterized protein n=1 Tax=Colletotrichum lupini TaxID=145971 RepID=A0A9Q8T9G2_9PEZI|nr:uncharacterized protein CLUP02_16834 [Colletotrichum lupini]UQC91300.1 hypothetical protein CLUP02_16834 [Colletotrichum lupini]
MKRTYQGTGTNARAVGTGIGIDIRLSQIHLTKDRKPRVRSDCSGSSLEWTAAGFIAQILRTVKLIPSRDSMYSQNSPF